MQCRYCGKENPDAVGVCAACHKLLPMSGHSPGAEKAPLARDGAPGILPNAPPLRFDRLSKACHLTGSASHKPSVSLASERERRWHARTADTSSRPVRQASAARPGERAEPRFASAPEGDAEELQRQYAFYEQFNTPPRRAHSLALPLAIVFAAGAALGLGATWWLAKPASPGMPGSSAVSARTAADMPVTRLDQQGHFRTTRGINPNELPYGGKAIGARRSTQVAAVPPQPTVSAELPHDRLPAAADNKKGDAPATASASVKPKPREAKEKAAPAVQLAEKKAHAKAHVKAAPKHRARKPSAKDREIARLKRQAEEELKKKIEHRRMVAQAEQKARYGALMPDLAERVRARFAQCSQAGNFFLREKCKWKVCSGMWGKNGCPSYRTPGPMY